MNDRHYENHDVDGVVLEGTALEVIAPTAIGLLNASEIEQQIATARKYPRAPATFSKEMRDMVTLDKATAMSCIYALPRAGKTIEGASVRFAEMANYSWGNTRVATRIVDLGDEYVTIEGLFFDTQKNTAVKSEVLRRITNREGRRFDADMIQVTAAAAGAIARRNAILVGIPKTLWMPHYESARQLVAGDIKALANQRADAIKAFAIFGIKPDQVYGVLGVKGVEDVTRDHLIILAGIKTAIDEKTLSPEEAFSPDKMKTPGDGGAPARPERSEFKPADDGKKPAGNAKPDPKAAGGRGGAPAKPKEEKAKPDEFSQWLASKILEAQKLDMAGLDQLDDVVCGAISKEKRDDELRPVWNEAYNTRKAAIEAAGQPQETKEEAQKREYEDWLAAQYTALEAATTVADVDALEDSVGNELAGDEAESAKWKTACGARVQAIRASRRR